MQDTQAAEALNALGNPTRIRLFRLLVKAGEEGMNVSDIQRHLQIPASTLAHHFSALAHAGLIVQSRQGREVISRANYKAMDSLIFYLRDECCSGVENSTKHTAA